MIRRRAAEEAPDVLEVLRTQLERQDQLVERELAYVRAAHRAERTPPGGTPPLPPQHGGSIPRRDRDHD